MTPQLPPGAPVLLVRRISKDTEQSSTLMRQAERLNEAATDGHYRVVAEVEDTTESGAVNLDERPKLGKWMREPHWDQWAAIMVTSMDRITREQYHWEQFAERCHRGGKEIIVLDDPSLDIHTPTGRLVAYVRASQAMEYRQANVAKRTDQLQYHRRESLWPGGMAPFGYRAVEHVHDGKKRWRLQPDPVTSELAREAYKRITEDRWSMNRLANDWNARGVLTSADYQRQIYNNPAKPVRGTKWSTSSLGKLLRNPALKGLASHRGGPLLRDGLPVRWTRGVLTDAEFDRLQAALDSLGKRHTGGRRGGSPLNGVLHCVCGRRMHEHSSRRNRAERLYRYFRCAAVNTGGGCPFRYSWPREETFEMIERAFLNKIGAEEVMEHRYMPGVDYSNKIAELEQAIENLAEEVAQAPVRVVRAALIATMERHAASVEELRKRPAIPSRWEMTGTGKTFAELWSDLDGWEQRGPFLRASGIRVFLFGNPRGYHEALVYTRAEMLRYALEASAGAPVSEDFDKIAIRTVALMLQERSDRRERKKVYRDANHA